MPEFKERSAQREARKQEELGPAIEQALKRKTWMKPLSDEEIPDIPALGRKILEELPEDVKRTAVQTGSGLAIPLSDPAEG